MVSSRSLRRVKRPRQFSVNRNLNIYIELPDMAGSISQAPLNHAIGLRLGNKKGAQHPGGSDILAKVLATAIGTS